MPRARGILLDVDGTLIDSTFLHAVCWHESFRQHGAHVTCLDAHRAIGLGSDEMLDHVLGAERDRSRDQAMQDTHIALYKQYWGRLTRLPGAAALVRTCHDAGLTTVLATSASESELQALRSALDCDDAIDVATSSTDADAGKPSPDILETALARADLRPEDVAYVGDAVWDGHTCAKLGVPFVAVLTGGLPEADLREAGAVEVWRSAAELVENFADSVVGRLVGAQA